MIFKFTLKLESHTRVQIVIDVTRSKIVEVLRKYSLELRCFTSQVVNNYYYPSTIYFKTMWFVLFLIKLVIVEWLLKADFNCYGVFSKQL